MGAELEALINTDESGLQGNEDIRYDPSIWRHDSYKCTREDAGRARKRFLFHSCKLELVVHSAVRILYDLII